MDNIEKKERGDSVSKAYVICYDPLWKLLIDRKLKKKDLQRMASLSANVITKMGKGYSVTLETLGRVCSALKCSLNDIVEIRLRTKPESN